jgi:hypothetical protein
MLDATSKHPPAEYRKYSIGVIRGGGKGKFAAGFNGR